MKADLETTEAGLYDALVAEARQALGIRPDKNKPLVARYVTEQLIDKGIIPAFVRDVARCLKQRLGLEVPPDTTAIAEQLDDAMPWTVETRTDTSLDDEIPF